MLNDGEIRLVSDLLIITGNDYQKALKKEMKYRDQYKIVSVIVNDYENYQYLKKDYQRIKSKQPKNRYDWEIERFRTFHKLKEPQEPTKDDYKVLYNYLNAKATIDECEQFYRSKRFEIFSLGQAEGEEVIKYYKDKVGWKDGNKN